MRTCPHTHDSLAVQMQEVPGDVRRVSHAVSGWRGGHVGRAFQVLRGLESAQGCRWGEVCGQLGTLRLGPSTDLVLGRSPSAEGDLPPSDVHHPGGDGGHGARQRQAASASFASHLFAAGKTPTGSGARSPGSGSTNGCQQQQRPPAILRAPGCGDARVRVV